jgi:acyl-coenzyme A synthetase/AMP-(fatty) acid ligase
MLGCWSAGLCISCINPAYTGDEIKRQLKSSNATCAVTVEFFLDSVRTARAENPTLKSIIIIGNDGAIDGCHSFSEMIKCDTKGVEFISGSKGGRNTCEDVALLPYSSGTTGNTTRLKFKCKYTRLITALFYLFYKYRSTKRSHAHSYKPCDQLETICKKTNCNICI